MVRAARLPAAERREQLLDTAGTILVELGFDALTMEAVAQRAGVSKGLGYAYFKNADDLVVELYERESDWIIERAREAIASADTYEGKVRASVASYFEHIAERGDLLNLLQAKVRDPAFEAHNVTRIQGLGAQWVAVIQAELGGSRRTAIMAAGFLLTAVVHATAAWHDDRVLPRADAEEACTQFILGGLAAMYRTAPDQRR